MTKELKALFRIKQYTYGDSDENDIKTIETSLKALEIIQTKGIDTDTFRLFHDYEDYQEYMEIYSSFANRYEHYTQEEFYLLKDLLLKKGE